MNETLGTVPVAHQEPNPGCPTTTSRPPLYRCTSFFDPNSGPCSLYGEVFQPPNALMMIRAPSLASLSMMEPTPVGRSSDDNSSECSDSTEDTETDSAVSEDDGEKTRMSRTEIEGSAMGLSFSESLTAAATTTLTNRSAPNDATDINDNQEEGHSSGGTPICVEVSPVPLNPAVVRAPATALASGRWSHSPYSYPLLPDITATQPSAAAPTSALPYAEPVVDIGTAEGPGPGPVTEDVPLSGFTRYDSNDLTINPAVAEFRTLLLACTDTVPTDKYQLTKRLVELCRPYLNDTSVVAVQVLDEFSRELYERAMKTRGQLPILAHLVAAITLEQENAQHFPPPPPPPHCSHQCCCERTPNFIPMSLPPCGYYPTPYGMEGWFPTPWYPAPMYGPVTYPPAPLLLPWQLPPQGPVPHWCSGNCTVSSWRPSEASQGALVVFQELVLERCRRQFLTVVADPKTLSKKANRMVRAYNRRRHQRNMEFIAELCLHRQLRSEAVEFILDNLIAVAPSPKSECFLGLEDRIGLLEILLGRVGAYLETLCGPGAMTRHFEAMSVLVKSNDLSSALRSKLKRLTRKPPTISSK